MNKLTPKEKQLIESTIDMFVNEIKNGKTISLQHISRAMETVEVINNLKGPDKENIVQYILLETCNRSGVVNMKPEVISEIC